MYFKAGYKIITFLGAIIRLHNNITYKYNTQYQYHTAKNRTTNIPQGFLKQHLPEQF